MMFQRPIIKYMFVYISIVFFHSITYLKIQVLRSFDTLRPFFRSSRCY